MGCLNVTVKDLCQDSGHLRMKVSIVCSVKKLHGYLRVSPEEVQWITPDYGIVYTVESDTDWIVVTA